MQALTSSGFAKSSVRQVPIAIFDTTLRDGEMALTTKMTLTQKLELAEALEAAGVDVIEVAYPGAFAKDQAELRAIAQHCKTATICGLAASQPQEIEAAIACLAGAPNGRINVFTPINLRQVGAAQQAAVLAQIEASVRQARQGCGEVQWSAFDATRCEVAFLARAIATALAAGASIISVPDSLGVASAAEFGTLLDTLVRQVPPLATQTLAVHCHDDMGLALENSLAGLAAGVRQIECSVNGLGARAGNADLRAVVLGLAQRSSGDRSYTTSIDLDALVPIEKRVAAQFGKSSAVGM